MNNLRYLRKTRTNLTMKQLGDKVGVSESAIGYYETGKREPDYEMLLKLSEALGCTVADIMESSDQNEQGYKFSSPKDALRFALYDGADIEITDEMYDEIKRFAAFAAQNQKSQNKKE